MCVHKECPLGERGRYVNTQAFSFSYNPSEPCHTILRLMLSFYRHSRVIFLGDLGENVHLTGGSACPECHNIMISKSIV